MDKIWDRKSFKFGGHWPLWEDEKRMTMQNRQKSNAKKNSTDKYVKWFVCQRIFLFFLLLVIICCYDYWPRCLAWIKIFIELFVFQCTVSWSRIWQRFLVPSKDTAWSCVSLIHSSPGSVTLSDILKEFWKWLVTELSKTYIIITLHTLSLNLNPFYAPCKRQGYFGWNKSVRW